MFDRKKILTVIAFISLSGSVFPEVPSLAQKKSEANELRKTAIELRNRSHSIEQNTGQLPAKSLSVKLLLGSKARDLIRVAETLERQANRLAPYSMAEMAEQMMEHVRDLNKKSSELESKGKGFSKSWHSHPIGASMIVQSKKLREQAKQIEREVEGIVGK